VRKTIFIVDREKERYAIATLVCNQDPIHLLEQN